MECMEARKALKSSLMTEMPMKTNHNNTDNYHQTMSDDIWCVKGSDDFSIDEYFNLPNDNDNIQNASFLKHEDDDEEMNSCHYGPVDHFFSTSLHFSPDLAIPVDDMQELELWSHLMDDSVPEVTTIPCPNPIIGFPPNKTGFNSLTRFEPGSTRVSVIPSVVPVKPRTKRSRTPGNHPWFTGSVSKTESPSSSSSSSSPTSTLVYPNPVHDTRTILTFKKPGAKNSKKKPGFITVNYNNKENDGPTVQRRCTHCQVTKTPQWRLGPNGPKSLCNACGVRFKSGRLFPEYRPACSPTFSSEIHSNSHRKVLEMRRKKEMVGSLTGSSSTISIS